MDSIARSAHSSPEEPIDDPEGFERIIAAISKRVAETPFDEVLRDLQILDFGPSLRFQGMHLLVKVLELVFIVAAVALLFTGQPISVRIAAWVCVAALHGIDRWMMRAEDEAGGDTESYREYATVTMACQWVHAEEIAEPGGAAAGWMGVAVTRDAELLRDPDRYELGAALCALANKHKKLKDRLPDQVRPELVKLMEPWEQSVPDQHLWAPEETFGGARVAIASVDFRSEHSPAGYVDRSFWPVLQLNLAGGKQMTALFPASYWWSEELDEVTWFRGPIGQAYQLIIEVWNEE